ncbi:hypothetical protein CCR80_12915 [Rhodothalassium salexigens]|uniref:hypothetical protein n=1 Tax=Rhodothalassium salexigens TaxID=1086 RepID=UPI001912116B|nr:hypothetical protein [Rhodothalassium salexigens]MBK5921934.1 hypothetical protein [Rhodothalassium salexigens]
MTRSALLACLLCGLAAPAVLAQQGGESEPEPPQAPAEDASSDRDRDQDRDAKDRDRADDRADDRGSARPRSLLRLGPFLDPDALDRPSAETLVGAQGPKDAATDAETAPLAPGTGVEEGALDRLGLEGIGTLGPDEALPPDLWHGSEPEVATALLAALPHRLRSQGVRQLWRQLLLSPALSPAAGRIPDALRLRLETLTAAGRVDDVLALSDAIPSGAMTADLAHLRADALLVGGRLDDGCALARGAARETGEARWLKMLALCEALAGNRSAAYLQISLLEESGEAGRLFPALIDRLLARVEGLDTGGDTGLPLATVERVDPILYAAFLAADVAPPAAAARTAPPLVLGELAVNALMAPPARLAVAEAAARMGLIGGGRLAALFDAMAFTDADLGTADAVLDDPAAINGLGSPENPPLDGMMIDALLFAKARRAQDPSTRLAFLDLLFERAITRGYAQVMAVAVAPLLDTVMPGADLIGHAGLVGRVHLVTGRMDAARRWYAEAEAVATAPGGDETRRAAARRALRTLTPLMLIAEGPAMAGYDAALARWAEDSAEHAPDRLQAGLVLLDALDGRVPAAAWGRALQAAAGPDGEAPAYPAPDPAVWRQLLIAAGTDRLGETVAAALALVGDAGAAQTDPAALSAAVGALADAGFQAPARRLAFEALIAGAR